jgi:hypothetical protein
MQEWPGRTRCAAGSLGAQGAGAAARRHPTAPARFAGVRLEEAGSAHFVQAEQPRLIAGRVRLLLGRSS